MIQFAKEIGAEKNQVYKWNWDRRKKDAKMESQEHDEQVTA